MKKYSKIFILIILVLIVGTGCSNPFIDNTKDNVSVFNEENLKVNYIDQTTPNMIQRISEIFERKPLISKEI